MDETPEEMEQIRKDAAAIDVHRYQKRFRAMKAIGIGGAAAGLVWLILIMVDSRRNPCERVRDHFCRQDATSSAACKMYTAIERESVDDASSKMRQTIRSQCQTKIERLKEEDGITVH
ncbi:MAG: hypothetical protein H7X95_13685 [Deltaproteobacteria bacterium]|nr:hypothetical protein [Deltaproteobacteria bacterium]